MKYSIPVNSSLKKSLKTYENSVINTSQKIPKIPLPPSVTSRDSTISIEEYESTHIDFDQFCNRVLKRLVQVRSLGQKNRLYKITLLVGNFDEFRISSLGGVPFIWKKPLPSRFTPEATLGGAMEKISEEM